MSSSTASTKTKNNTEGSFGSTLYFMAYLDFVQLLETEPTEKHSTRKSDTNHFPLSQKSITNISRSFWTVTYGLVITLCDKL